MRSFTVLLGKLLLGWVAWRKGSVIALTWLSRQSSFDIFRWTRCEAWWGKIPEPWNRYPCRRYLAGVQQVDVNYPWAGHTSPLEDVDALFRTINDWEEIYYICSYNHSQWSGTVALLTFLLLLYTPRGSMLCGQGGRRGGKEKWKKTWTWT